jgi:ABC-type multidrug transport system ATPase subunit
VSGGERKRTSIAVELITNPSVIFLDEPTTGLDSVTALRIVTVLAEMADHGRNIMCTIHQPNSKIFESFDELMILLKGNIIYQGKASNAVEYFG